MNRRWNVAGRHRKLRTKWETVARTVASSSWRFRAGAIASAVLGGFQKMTDDAAVGDLLQSRANENQKNYIYIHVYITTQLHI